MFHATKISTYPCINLGSKPLEFYNQFAVHFSQLFNNVYILEALWTLISDRSDPYKFFLLLCNNICDVSSFAT